MKDFKQYLLNVERSPIDDRDWLAESIYPVKATYPETLDLRNNLQPIRDQGNQGTCVAQTGACMKEWQEKFDSEINEHMSPQFIYNLRENQGSSGMYPRNLMSILKNVGSILEADYPYYTMDKISDELKDKAKKNRIEGYAKLNTIDSVKAALNKNGPCLIAVPVYNYGMRMWKPTSQYDESLGGHAMTIVGYNKVGFIIRNSWGMDWGDFGYTIFPYEDWGLHWEAWTTIDADSRKEPEDDIETLWYKIKNWIIQNKGKWIYLVGGALALYGIIELLIKIF